MADIDLDKTPTFGRKKSSQGKPRMDEETSQVKPRMDVGEGMDDDEMNDDEKTPGSEVEIREPVQEKGDPMAHMFELTDQLREMLNAETNTGIQFDDDLVGALTKALSDSGENADDTWWAIGAMCALLRPKNDRFVVPNELFNSMHNMPFREVCFAPAGNVTNDADPEEGFEEVVPMFDDGFDSRDADAMVQSFALWGMNDRDAEQIGGTFASDVASNTFELSEQDKTAAIRLYHGDGYEFDTDRELALAGMDMNNPEERHQVLGYIAATADNGQLLSNPDGDLAERLVASDILYRDRETNELRLSETAFNDVIEFRGKSNYPVRLLNAGDVGRGTLQIQPTEEELAMDEKQDEAFSNPQHTEPAVHERHDVYTAPPGEQPILDIVQFPPFNFTTVKLDEYDGAIDDIAQYGVDTYFEGFLNFVDELLHKLQTFIDRGEYTAERVRSLGDLFPSVADNLKSLKAAWLDSKGREPRQVVGAAFHFHRIAMVLYAYLYIAYMFTRKVLGRRERMSIAIGALLKRFQSLPPFKRGGSTLKELVVRNAALAEFGRKFMMLIQQGSLDQEMETLQPPPPVNEEPKTIEFTASKASSGGSAIEVSKQELVFRGR